VTALILDKGRKNTRLLVQAQYSPMAVEKQVAILYCGVKGLLRNVPIESVHEFETAFLDNLAISHQEDVLDVIKSGVINDDVKKILEETAEKVSKQFIK
jgi:F-type H+-transporting ATPase subunit alpha